MRLRRNSAGQVRGFRRHDRKKAGEIQMARERFDFLLD
jgi:hypothetical protein